MGRSPNPIEKDSECVVGGDFMYTEYVFENKSYEVALRDIKSILFDIVAQEEKNIADLREKAFSDTPAVNAPAMQSLFIQQDERLRNVLGISDQLTKAIQDVDTCAKDLHAIEKEGMQQVLSGQQSKPDLSLQAAVGNALQASTVEEETVEEKTPANMGEIADAMSTDEGDSMSQEAEEEAKAGISTMTDDLIAAHSDEEEAKEPELDFSENPVITNPVIPIDESAVQSVEAQAEESSGEEKPDLIIAYNDDVSTIEESPEEKTEEAPAEQADAASTEEKPDLIFAYNDDISTIKDMDEEAEAEATDAEANTEATATEEPVLTPIAEDPAPVAAEAEPAEEVVEETTAEEETDDIAMDEEVEEETPVENVADVAPVDPVPVEPTASTGDVPSVIIFRKRNADAPRGIMISKEQSTKLKASVAVQTALLNAKGVLQTSYSGEKQLEAMMEEANALYAEGKVAEAQDKIEQINAYTKGMTESVGIAA